MPLFRSDWEPNQIMKTFELPESKFVATALSKFPYETYDESIGIGAFLIMRTTLTLIDVLRKSKIYISARSFVCFIPICVTKL